MRGRGWRDFRQLCVYGAAGSAGELFQERPVRLALGALRGFGFRDGVAEWGFGECAVRAADLDSVVAGRSDREAGAVVADRETLERCFGGEAAGAGELGRQCAAWILVEAAVIDLERAFAHRDREASLLLVALGRQPRRELTPQAAPLRPTEPPVGPAAVGVGGDGDRFSPAVLP